MKPYYETDLGRLYHGDCLEIMGQLEPVDLVLTDPPYGVSWQSNWRKNKFNKIHNDEKVHYKWLSYLKTNVLYSFAKWSVMQEWIDQVLAVGLSVNDVLIWDKLAHGAGNLKSWAPTYEMIIYATNGRVELNGKRPQNVLRHWRVDAGATGKSSGKLLKHPAQKPESLFIEIIKRHSGIVLDPFIGSGTTAIACERLNRKWIGIEIEEKYCEIAAKRIELERKQRKLF